MRNKTNRADHFVTAEEKEVGFIELWVIWFKVQSSPEGKVAYS